MTEVGCAGANAGCIPVIGDDGSGKVDEWDYKPTGREDGQRKEVKLVRVGQHTCPACDGTGVIMTNVVQHWTGDDGTAVDVSSGVRATDRAGYDNQPHFLPGGQILLFTSIDESGQADIFQYGLESKETSHLTDTSPEREYSATVMPAGDRVSVIRVDADSAQRLWSFDLSGQDPKLLLPEIAPVGYHAWIDEDRLALFVLGNPATLQIASLSRGTGEIVAYDIGRSLYRIPGTGRVSFLQWQENRRGAVTALDPQTGETEVLALLLEGNEYYAWTPSQALIMGQGSKLFRFDSVSHGSWTEMADLGPAGVEGISRIAISPEGDRIAIVGVGR